MTTLEEMEQYINVEVHSRCDYDIYSTLLDFIHQQQDLLCDNCQFDHCGCSVQNSILQVNSEATFTTFGCNSFESCK